MTVNTISLKLSLFSLIFLITIKSVTAQSKPDYDNPQTLQNIILEQDSLFWITYNHCDVDGMKAFFTDDIEFYHDKGGLTTTLNTLIENTKNGMCGNDNWRLRREVVEESVSVYPVPNYGAVLTGEHIFFINEKGKKEYLDGQANFLHIWRYEDNTWKMSRVVSYAHRPPEYNPGRVEISLPNETLSQFVGDYQAINTGMATIAKDEKGLILKSGGFEASLHPESENLFFINERDLQFKFMKEGDKTKMLIIENGETVDEAIKIN